jgi:hypothetical protein
MKAFVARKMKDLKRPRERPLNIEPYTKTT